MADVLMPVCDGLKGLPDAITTTWPLTTVQACIIHLIRNTFRYASRRDWDAISKALRPVYTAPTESAAAARFDELADTWGAQYPAIIRLWKSAWPEFIPSWTTEPVAESWSRPGAAVVRRGCGG
jgi:putative transposase